MQTYAIIAVPAAHKEAFEAAAWETHNDGLGAPWCAAASPSGPITHWIMGDTMDAARLAFYQFPEDHPFVPMDGFPVNDIAEAEVIAARAAARVYTVTAETLSAPDYQEARDICTGMLGIVPMQMDI